MKAGLSGSIVLSLTMREARELYRALSPTALNARHKHEQPLVDLYAALSRLLNGPGAYNPPSLS